MTTQQSHHQRDNRKRAVAIGLVGLGIAGLAAASAATLAVTAGGTDKVAGGSANVTIEGAGLSALHVDLGSTQAPAPVWNINENWPAGSAPALTLSDFNGTDGDAVAGTYDVAVYDTLTSGAAGTKLASGTVDAAGGEDALTVPLTLASGTWGDLLTNSKSVTVVFEAE
ncbi:hypothetical protein [Cellulomonas alba]|uniref:WxL domain-containing protein n=1 Tax=Cellulomonas alba TaxID=3053467 RepID=A0ABT7SGX8_9CELL|nr:hypothetical protein [Cellulomonas alba]MDM7855426.1 hypothetical protein [Cellulomonas alba]